jgi:hypothetical protein
MAAAQMPVKVLAIGDLREFPARDGRPASKVRQLQCFTGEVVGTIAHYIREGVKEITQPGDYMATIEFGNYQGKLTPRITALQPMKGGVAG